MEATTSKVYTLAKLEAYGDRLHINTALTIPINGLAIFLIMKYSTKAMGFYKYYNLMTIIGVFFMDFHCSFIFGMYSLFPAPAICCSGISRNWGWFWGEIVNYNFIHISASISGFSIFYGILYQYVSLNGNVELFHKPLTFVTMIAFMIIYPLPLVVLHSINVDYPESLIQIKKHYPHMYQLYISAPCNLNLVNLKGLIYVFTMFLQMFIIYFLAFLLVYKIRKQLSEMQSSLTAHTLIARRQYLFALTVQLSMPLIFIAIPVLVIFTFVIAGISNVDEIANWILQILGVHSCGNALTIILIIKPYRKAVFGWLKKIKSVIWKSNSAVDVALPAFEPSTSVSPAVIN